MPTSLHFLWFLETLHTLHTIHAKRENAISGNCLTFIVDWLFKRIWFVWFEREMVKPPLRVPDAPGGLRFCVACNNILSVDAFPRETRRNTRKNHGTTTAQKAKAERMRDTNQRIAYRLWGKAYGDSKRFICAWKSIDGATVHTTMKGHVAITLCEIEQLLRAATDYPSEEMYENPMDFAKRITVVPRNPRKILSFDNAVLVMNTVKRKLFRAFKLEGLQGYTNALSGAQRNSRNVFIPNREQIKTMQSQMNILLDPGEV
jgi:hypothetical protein